MSATHHATHPPRALPRAAGPSPRPALGSLRAHANTSAPSVVSVAAHWHAIGADEFNCTRWQCRSWHHRHRRCTAAGRECTCQWQWRPWHNALANCRHCRCPRPAIVRAAVWRSAGRCRCAARGRGGRTAADGQPGMWRGARRVAPWASQGKCFSTATERARDSRSLLVQLSPRAPILKDLLPWVRVFCFLNESLPWAVLKKINGDMPYYILK